MSHRVHLELGLEGSSIRFAHKARLKPGLQEVFCELVGEVLPWDVSLLQPLYEGRIINQCLMTYRKTL